MTTPISIRQTAWLELSKGSRAVGVFMLKKEDLVSLFKWQGLQYDSFFFCLIVFDTYTVLLAFPLYSERRLYTTYWLTGPLNLNTNS